MSDRSAFRSLFLRVSSGEIGGVGGVREAKYGDLAGAFLALLGFDLESRPACSISSATGDRSDDVLASFEVFGAGTGVCFDANLPFDSLVRSSSLTSGMAEVEALRLARGLGGGMGVSFFGANLPFESRSRERSAFSRVEDPIEARLFAGVLAGVPFFAANLP